MKSYLAVCIHRVTQITLEHIIIIHSGRGAQDGNTRTRNLTTYDLCLDIVDRLGYGQVEGGLVRVLSRVVDLQVEFQSLLTAYRIFFQVARIKDKLKVTIQKGRVHQNLNYHGSYGIIQRPIN